jgi:hypothetical protein
MTLRSVRALRARRLTVGVLVDLRSIRTTCK